jgi:membrane-associated phospholipid phosphatase
MEINEIQENNFIEKIIDFIGFLAPHLLFIISILLLWNKKYYLVYYIVGYGFNIVLNLILKGIIRQPRPSEDIKLINISKNNGKRISYDKFGMPSGHAQLSFFSVVFIYLVFKNIPLTIFYIIISLFSLHQRVKYKNHTLLQVIIGTLVGAFVGFAIYMLTKRNVGGKWIAKKEDNALN